VASLAGLVAHGGVAGAIAESLIAVAVVGIFVAIWIRERRARKEQADDGPASLTDHEA
jgi:mannose/fructose/N-acetylgalactosamine-specific phosphotransferase system component IIC